MIRRCLHQHLLWSLGAGVALSVMACLPTACSHDWEELRFAGAATGGGTTSSTSTGGNGAGAAGGSGGTGGHTSTTTTGAQGGATGCPDNSGECVGDYECDGGSCVALSECGYRVCVSDVPEATSCDSGLDQCCNSAECDGDQTCLKLPIEPTCTGFAPEAYNQCFSPGCDPDSAVTVCSADGQICVPAGALGRKVARCMGASCLQDSDCTELSDGRCVPVTPYCCDGPVGLYCVYPGGCTTQADCQPSGRFCVVDQGRGWCGNEEPTCT